MRYVFLLGSVLLLLPLQLTAQFNTHVDYPTGQVPFGVAAGDFNGDAKLDLAVTNSVDNTVSVLLGNGNGTFQPRVDYATGARPTSVVVADFNGDGKLDLAITNGSGNSVSVLLGNGDGTFRPHADYATNTNPQFLVAADFNGDGHLDLATANYGPDYSPGTVSVFLGNGDGTFQPERSYPAGINPFGIMAGDFNRDGKIDLAVTNNNGAWGVWILLGNGDGSFQSTAFYGTGANPRQGVVADLNGDGNLDLVAANCIDNDISMLLGDGQGHFSSPVNYPAGEYIQAVSGGDFNLDGKLDLVTANAVSNSVSVLLGNGDGTFEANVDYATGNGPNSIAIGDFNGDGTPDIVTANYASNTVSVLLNAFRTTTTALVSTLNPAAPWQPVTYIATVTSKQGTETGTVEFKHGSSTIATVTLANHTAAFTTRYRWAGIYTITATYSGDEANNGSTSPALTEYIRGSSRTWLTTSASSSAVGDPVTFTATVTSRYGDIPDGGTVAFYDGPIALGSATLASGTAAYTTSALAAQIHIIRAVYGGTPIYGSSEGRIRQFVRKQETTTSLTADMNPSRRGQTVTFTARVTSDGSTIATGRVRFKDDARLLDVVSLSGGIATLAESKLSPGRHWITAHYEGDNVSAKSKSLVWKQEVRGHR